MDLLLSFRGAQLPHLPFYCPVLFDPQRTLVELAGDIAPQSIERDAAEPIIEVFDLLAPLTPEQRRHTVFCEFVTKHRARAICPQLRKPSTLRLLEEAPERTTRRAGTEAGNRFAWLRRFDGFKHLGDTALAAIVGAHPVARASNGTVLIKAGIEDARALFLIKGSLRIESVDGANEQVDAGSARARAPISQLRPHRYSVSALTKVEYLSVPDEVLRRNSPPAAATTDTGGKAPGAGGAWFQDLFEDLLHDRLFLPSLPDVVSRIRQAMDAAATGIETIACIVETDPAIAAQVVKVANGCDRAPVTSCIEAVTRLEVETTRRLVHTAAVQEPFRAPARALRARLREAFQHSSKVAAICHVLARMTPHLAPQQALLAGLLHQVGELAIIKYVGRQPELANDVDQVDQLIRDLGPEVGAAVLRKWHFADSLAGAAAECQNWTRDAGNDTDYCDLVIVAKLHSYMGTPKMATAPHMNEVPAFAKLGRFNPKLSLGILNQAKSQLAWSERLLVG